MICTVRYNAALNKFEGMVNGAVVAKSKDKEYFEYHVRRGDVPKLAGIQRVVYEGDPTVTIGTNQAEGAQLPITPHIEYSINEKFEMLEDLISMTAKGSFKATLITGKGGVGKTFTVLSVLQRLGFENYDKLIATEMPADIEEEDDEEVVQEKVNALAALDQRKTYRVYKGYTSSAALYRLLYENRTRVIVFDDCDSVLMRDEAISLLKGALDTYEERWISWNVNSPFTDLPACFKFEGKIIFISNMQMLKVDEAVRTRCSKVDVSMTPMQRIERMEAVLDHVLPEIDMQYKLDALDLLRENAHTAKDISFRSLMNTITIRVDEDVKDWRKLARFSLLEN